MATGACGLTRSRLQSHCARVSPMSSVRKLGASRDHLWRHSQPAQMYPHGAPAGTR